MFNKWLKPLLPKSLYWRAVLILIVPIILIQVVVSIVLLQRLFEDVTRQMTSNVALELTFIVDQVENAPNIAVAREKLSTIVTPLGVLAEIHPSSEKIGYQTDTRVFYDLSGSHVISVLRDQVPGTRLVDLKNQHGSVLMEVETRYGILVAQFDRNRVSASNPHQLLVIMSLASLFLATLAILFLRNLIRPIRQLSYAAEAFGKGRSEPFRPRGATEVRRAGNAFLAMRSRIERQIEQRTLMLSGVSHDLRTPLTRMKLSLSLLEESPEQKHLKADVDEMQRMLDGFLAFARGDASEEIVETDTLALAEDLVVTWQRNSLKIDIAVTGAEEFSKDILCRRTAVQRALNNLIGNAEKFASNVRLTLVLAASFVEFLVEDNGPGIPENLRETALKPFARLDLSRNQNKGSGVGLGLSIALDTARSHGGSFTLSESPDLGGLRAEFRLPR